MVLNLTFLDLLGKYNKHQCLRPPPQNQNLLKVVIRHLYCFTYILKGGDSDSEKVDNH